MNLQKENNSNTPIQFQVQSLKVLEDEQNIDDVTYDITCLQKSHQSLDFLQARQLNGRIVKSYVFII